MIRKTIFWIHLVCGVAAAAVILMMSATGVILTYERQLLDFFGPSVADTNGQGALPLADLVAAVRAAEPDYPARTITVPAEASEPVIVGAGRGSARLVDPYSGAVLGDGESALGAFFGTVTGWHRWFNASRESRGPWRAITGASNLIFLFLIVSGLYLWLPRIMRWAMFRARLVFVPWSTPGKARDFNWHHVLGIWSAIPLIVIVATASVFYYPWANELVYRSFGELPPGAARPQPAAERPGAPATNATAATGPVRAGAPSGASAAAAAGGSAPTGAMAQPAIPLTHERLLAIAAGQVESWQTITLPAELAADSPAQISIDRGNGGQPQHRHTVVLDTVSGNVVEWQPFTSQSPGRQARSWVRFLHTGEALGLIGQTIAGLVSLTSVFMVWTGLALAWRRLISPLFARRA